MQKLALLIILFCWGVMTGHAQDASFKGVPLIRNHTPAEYGAVGKAWRIQSAPNGVVYFATDKGLLEFDGHRWRAHSGSKGVTRSLFIASDSLLFTGSDRDFGLWQVDDRARFSYASLNPFRAKGQTLSEDFWGTYQMASGVVFVSFDNVYVHTPEQLTKISAPTRFYGSAFAAGTVYLFDERDGLLAFDGMNITPVANFSPDLTDLPRIVAVHQTAEGPLVVTRAQGVFTVDRGQLRPLKFAASPSLERDRVFSFTAIDDTHYAFGTILNGVYITDLEGRVVHHINKRKGLLNNTVLSLHYGKNGQLWLGMDFGIASVDLWGSVTYFLDQRGQVGAGHTGFMHEGTFFLGTNQGLYYAPWEALNNSASLPDFRLVPGSSGQVWTLAEIDGQLLCGHDRGLFRLSDDGLLPLHDEPGVLTISALDDEHLLTGNYEGISLFRKTDNGWTFLRKLPPVMGACNQIIPGRDGQTLWLNLPNFGLIKASLNARREISRQRIFPVTGFSGDLPQVFLDSGVVKVITATSLYAYQAAADSFYFQRERRVVHPVANGREGAHRPFPLNDTYRFWPTHNGFALERGESRGAERVLTPLVIRSVRAFSNDTTVFVAPGGTLPGHLNNVRLDYVVPHEERARYQYYLEGLYPEWSAWSPEPYLELVDLPPGDYVFRLRGRVGDRVSPERSVPFSVTVPWYRAWGAYLFYGLLLLGLIFLNYWWQARKLRLEKRKRREQETITGRLRAAAAERERIQKQYLMLEEALGETKKQLRAKTINLARKAKESDEKGRLLLLLKEKVTEMLGASGATPFQLKQLSHLLDRQPETEDNSFSLQMEELHRDFLKELGDRYPELTNYDLRLSAYLKSGLSTREIAEITNVLPSSVNVSRSRLRKKLGLDAKESLSRFLREFA